MAEEIVRYPEGVARFRWLTNATQLLQSCTFEKTSFPRVAKAQPWAGISERFQRYSLIPVVEVAELEELL